MFYCATYSVKVSSPQDRRLWLVVPTRRGGIGPGFELRVVMVTRVFMVTRVVVVMRFVMFTRVVRVTRVGMVR